MHSARKHAENPPMQMQLFVRENRWNQGMKEGKAPSGRRLCWIIYRGRYRAHPYVGRRKVRRFDYLEGTRRHQDWLERRL
jgi:hypothetical protein